jgi:hypothetical protein
MSAIGQWDDTGSVVPSKTDAARHALLCESRLNDSLENPSNNPLIVPDAIHAAEFSVEVEGISLIRIGGVADHRLRLTWREGERERGDWETGRLGDWETGRLGDWETRRRDWETGRW